MKEKKLSLLVKHAIHLLEKKFGIYPIKIDFNNSFTSV